MFRIVSCFEQPSQMLVPSVSARLVRGQVKKCSEQEQEREDEAIPGNAYISSNGDRTPARRSFRSWSITSQSIGPSLTLAPERTSSRGIVAVRS